MKFSLALLIVALCGAVHGGMLGVLVAKAGIDAAKAKGSAIAAGISGGGSASASAGASDDAQASDSADGAAAGSASSSGGWAGNVQGLVGKVNSRVNSAAGAALNLVNKVANAKADLSKRFITEASGSVQNMLATGQQHINELQAKAEEVPVIAPMLTTILGAKSQAVGLMRDALTAATALDKGKYDLMNSTVHGLTSGAALGVAAATAGTQAGVDSFTNNVNKIGAVLTSGISGVSSGLSSAFSGLTSSGRFSL